MLNFVVFFFQACAPRYYWFKSVNNAQAVRDPVGTCYLAYSQFQESDEYSPCRTSKLDFQSLDLYF